ncbi:outer membrane lipoprotein carrier protein LolA [Gorillibacterium timonense]|uniref:outer membrane lipoprotein carrier protein LolA n=1 Tax=Gorillibacterium timonense TaxID=1689269 RepID=UPI0009EA418E|nr:outer membrane lipoprotein carrier protein LolA [Gorillibacterium timonense]
MRRIRWMTALVVLCLAVALGGCGGKKDAGSVVNDLKQKLGKLDSYKTSGRMVLQNGQQPQEYQLDVWFQNPHFYRIALTNQKQDITQIVLRNDDGVFVLTPHLNKSFRFQSDWPDNQGQYYLYQSLVSSIVTDKDRKFTTEGDNLIFDVAANYANTTLTRQKIWLSKKDYSPKRVEVRDTNDTTLVTVDFTAFSFGEKFTNNSFDTTLNLKNGAEKADPSQTQLDDPAALLDSLKQQPDTVEQAANANAVKNGKTDEAKNGKQAEGADGSQAVSGQPVSDGSDAADANKAGDKSATADKDASKAGDKSATADKATDKAADKTAGTNTDGAGNLVVGETGIEVYQPLLPEGVAFAGADDLKLGEDQAVLLRYTGTYNFTLLESEPKAQEVMLLPGTSIDLGFTIGTFTGEDKRTLTWTNNGRLYRLSSADLPVSMMVTVAQSLQGESEK